MKRRIKKIYHYLTRGFRRRRVASLIRGGRQLTSRRELQDLLGAPVLLHDLEVLALQKYAARATERIIEIGAAYGASSLLFILAKKDLVKVFSIDPFIQDSMGKFQASRDGCYKNVTRALVASGLDSRVKDWSLVPDYSYNFIKSFRDPTDVLFIDGDHHYEAVKKDFVDWFPRVKVGGLILFHDSCRVPGTPEDTYNRGWPGPSRLVSELSERSDLKLVEQTQSLSVFQRLS